MKFIKLFFKTLVLFLLYFVASLVAISLLQSALRTAVSDNRYFEIVWKSVVSYAVMVCLGAVVPLMSNGELRGKYVQTLMKENWYEEEKKYNLKDGVLFTLKTPEALFSAVFFMIWPIVFSDMMKNFNLLYFDRFPRLIAAVPSQVLVVLTVDLPFFILFLAASAAIEKKWAYDLEKEREEKERQEREAAFGRFDDHTQGGAGRE